MIKALHTNKVGRQEVFLGKETSEGSTEGGIWVKQRTWGPGYGDAGEQTSRPRKIFIKAWHGNITGVKKKKKSNLDYCKTDLMATY